MKRVNIALIGCGYWGSKLQWYIEGNDLFNLVKVCNSKSNLDEVYLDKTIRAVVVATPMAIHYEIVKAALLAGKRVLCEKPLTLKTSECEELREIAEERGHPLLVDYTYTFSRALEQAQVLIKGRRIGKVLGYSLTARQWGRFDRGSVYWLLASHLLSIVDMFLPLGNLSFSKTDLVCRGGKVESGVICFGGWGQVGVLNVSIDYPGKEFSVVVYGEEGTIVYNPLTAACLKFERYDGKREQCHSDEANNLSLVVKAFVEMLYGRRDGSVARAVAVTRVIEELGLDKK